MTLELGDTVRISGYGPKAMVIHKIKVYEKYDPNKEPVHKETRIVYLCENLKSFYFAVYKINTNIKPVTTRMVLTEKKIIIKDEDVLNRIRCYGYGFIIKNI